MTQATPPWRPWGDHPIIVGILAIAAIIGVIVIVLPFVSQERPVTYSGRVRSNSVGAPIAAAKVTLDFGDAQQIDYSDAEGYFRFSLTSASQTGNGTIRVEADGYNSYELNVTIMPNTLQLQDIRLTPDVAVASTPLPSEDAASVLVTATSSIEPSAAPATSTVATPQSAINTSTLEEDLLAVNVLLAGPESSPEQVAQVRSYLRSAGYQALAKNILDMVGNRKFTRPVHLDTINGKYIRLVAPNADNIPDDQYGNSELLQTAILEHWNEQPGYPDATSFDAIVEPGS